MKVLLVGAGFIGKRAIEALNWHNDISISAIVDTRPESLIDIENEYLTFLDIDSALSAVDSDLAFIATPPETHFQMAKKCLDRGLHVYLEKIMTIYSDDAKDIVKQAEDRGLNVFVRRNGMYKDAYIDTFAMKEEIGKIRRVDYVEPVGEYSEWSDYKSDWLKDLPGRIISEHLPHPLYLIRWYLGEQPSVSYVDYFEGELHIGFKGSSSNASISFIESTDVPMLVRIVGSKGVIEANHNSMRVRRIYHYSGGSMKTRALKSNIAEIVGTCKHLLRLGSRYLMKTLRTRSGSERGWNDLYNSMYWQFEDIKFIIDEKKAGVSDSRNCLSNKESHRRIARIDGKEGVQNVELFEEVWRKAGINPF